MRVLVACEFSGVVRDAFIARGHDAVSCDIEETEAPGPHYKGDVRDILDDGWDMLVAHPPCTRLCNSGVRWLDKPPPGRTRAEMWEELDDAAAFYSLLWNCRIKRKVVENPVMHPYARERVRNYKQPKYVQPWWFGNEAFKNTGLTLAGLPTLRPTKKLVPPKPGTEEHKRWSSVHRAPPGPNRARDRSRTFPGIAAALAEQHGDLVAQFGDIL